MFDSVFDRRDNSCTNGTYTTPNGLEFNRTCNTNSPNGDLSQITDVTLDECMDACSRINQDRCYGISYNVKQSKCWMKNSTTFDLSHENGTHTAIANLTQLESTNTTCPYSNEAWKTAPSGLQFEIYCNKDMDGHDLDPTNWSYWPQHANSLVECMELCAEAHPLCLAVSWNVDMVDGYPNCYPKSSGDTGTLFSPSGYISHSAIASFVYPNSSCVDDSYYTRQSSNSNSTFRVSCGENISNNTLESTYAATIDACINTCDSFQSETETCAGVAFDNTLADGYENCYLKTSSSPTSSANNYTIAIRSKSISTQTTTVSKSSGSEAGVIAGATIGGVAALAALAAFAYFWLRSRNKQKQKLGTGPKAMNDDFKPTITSGSGVGVPVEEQRVRKLGGSHLVHELQSDQQIHELHDSQVHHELK